MNQSNLAGNDSLAINAVVVDDPPTSIPAVYNWWGATDSASIENMIFHRVDAAQYPLVIFKPFAYQPFEIDDSIATYTSEPENDPVPGGCVLHQNYPNPFNPSTTFEFELPRPTYTSISIYNVLGQEVSRLVERELRAGRHTISWDGTDADGARAATGVYFYRLVAGDFIDSKKMLLLR